MPTKPISEKELVQISRTASILSHKRHLEEFANLVDDLIHSYRELLAAGQALRGQFQHGQWCRETCAAAKWDLMGDTVDQKGEAQCRAKRQWGGNDETVRV